MRKATKISFNIPYISGNELNYIKRSISKRDLSGDGFFTKKCSDHLENLTKSKRILLTHSCTASLELCAMLLNIKPGDEVILPSYTFVSTANAFSLRGAIPIFADIDERNLNIDVSKIEELITKKTKAIIVVHYAGVACQMDKLKSLSKKYKLPLIEDAAQGLNSYYKGSHIGTIGDLGCISFHETKNIGCGEGGALLLNNKKYIERAEILREKGTDRSKFIRGEIDKYSWKDIGSSYLLSEINAAFLYAQLKDAKKVTEKRKVIWNKYNKFFSKISEVITPDIPNFADHNAHIFYIIFSSVNKSNEYLEFMSKNNISCARHYVSLHKTSFYKNFYGINKKLKITEKISNKLVRLPLYPSVDCKRVLEASNRFFQKNKN